MRRRTAGSPRPRRSCPRPARARNCASRPSRRIWRGTPVSSPISSPDAGLRNGRDVMALSSLHRRHVLAGIGAALVAPAMPAGAAAFRRKVGSAEVTVLGDGTLNVPLAMLLPETPAADAATLS